MLVMSSKFKQIFNTNFREIGGWPNILATNNKYWVAGWVWQQPFSTNNLLGGLKGNTLHYSNWVV